MAQLNGDLYLPGYLVVVGCGSGFFSRVVCMSKSDSSGYQDLSLLGSSASLPTSPEEASLETFPNPSPNREYTIELDATDFSSLCPVTGQPDAARILITYVPKGLCVETKSLKFYLASWRNTAAFNETIVNQILDDLVDSIKPVRAVVRGEFAPRGGIKLTAEATH